MNPIPRVPAPARPERNGKWLITALLFMCASCPAADESRFGRLFTTPAQRQHLQALREEHRQTLPDRDNTVARNPGTEQAGASAATGAQAAPVVTLRGLIYRNGETRMAWIDERDGDEHRGAATPDYRELEVAATPGHEIAVPVPMGGKSIMLKPGQSYHPDSGSVTDITRRVLQGNKQSEPGGKSGLKEPTP